MGVNTIRCWPTGLYKKQGRQSHFLRVNDSENRIEGQENVYTVKKREYVF